MHGQRAVERVAAPRIGIIGPWGGNLGDAAIQQAMIDHIRIAYPDAAIFGFSLSPWDTERRHGIPAFPIGRLAEAESGEGAQGVGFYRRLMQRLQQSEKPLLRSLARWMLRAPKEIGIIRSTYANLRGMRYVIISGGGQLDDYWGGAWSHPYTLLKFAVLAKLRGARFLLVSVGAGPLDGRLSRLFTRMTLSLAGYRSYRDADSRGLVQRIGFRRADPVYPDLAQSLMLSPQQLADLKTPTAPYLVGIGPMSYFDPRIWPERDQQVYLGYLGKLADMVVWLVDQGHRAMFYIGEEINDRPVIKDLRAILAERGIAHDDPRISEPPIETVDDLMTQLARADLVIASRFHGVLLPQLLNKPVLALSYHPKIDHLMADMGQADYCLPIDRFDVEVAKERFLAMAADREAIKATMAKRTQQYREALDEQYRRIFGNG